AKGGRRCSKAMTRAKAGGGVASTRSWSASAIAPRRKTARSRAFIESAVELLRPVVGERKRNRKAITTLWIAEQRELQMHRRERQWTLLDGLINSAPVC